MSIDCATCKYQDCGDSDDPCIECSQNDINYQIPEINPSDLLSMWEPLAPVRNYVLVTQRHSFIQCAILFWGQYTPDEATDRSFAGYTNNFDTCEKYTREDCEKYNATAFSKLPFYGEDMRADTLSWLKENDFFIEISRLGELGAKQFTIYYRQ